MIGPPLSDVPGKSRIASRALPGVELRISESESVAVPAGLGMLVHPSSPLNYPDPLGDRFPHTKFLKNTYLCHALFMQRKLVSDLFGIMARLLGGECLRERHWPLGLITDLAGKMFVALVEQNCWIPSGRGTLVPVTCLGSCLIFLGRSHVSFSGSASRSPS